MLLFLILIFSFKFWLVEEIDSLVKKNVAFSKATARRAGDS